MPTITTPPSFTVVGSTLYFSVYDAAAGYGLWKSDGTAAGTVLVKDVSPGVSSSHPRSLTAVGNTLYFRADDGSSGVELWKSDGTSAGTVQVMDLNPGVANGFGRILN